MNASSTVAATMTVVTVLCCSGVTQADLIRLSNGGELRGELQESPARDASQLVIRTLTGAVVSVSRDRRALKTMKHAHATRPTPLTVNGNWRNGAGSTGWVANAQCTWNESFNSTRNTVLPIAASTMSSRTVHGCRVKN